MACGLLLHSYLAISSSALVPDFLCGIGSQWECWISSRICSCLACSVMSDALLTLSLCPQPFFPLCLPPSSPGSRTAEPLLLLPTLGPPYFPEVRYLGCLLSPASSLPFSSVLAAQVAQDKASLDFPDSSLASGRGTARSLRDLGAEKRKNRAFLMALW